MVYNPLTNLLLASWDTQVTQVVEVPKNVFFIHQEKNWKPKHPGFFKWVAINSMMIPNLYHGKMGGNNLFHPSKNLWFRVPGGPVAR